MSRFVHTGRGRGITFLDNLFYVEHFQPRESNRIPILLRSDSIHPGDSKTLPPFRMPPFRQTSARFPPGFQWPTFTPKGNCYRNCYRNTFGLFKIQAWIKGVIRKIGWRQKGGGRRRRVPAWTKHASPGRLRPGLQPAGALWPGVCRRGVTGLPGGRLYAAGGGPSGLCVLGLSRSARKPNEYGPALSTEYNLYCSPGRQHHKRTPGAGAPGRSVSSSRRRWRRHGKERSTAPFLLGYPGDRRQ